MQKILITSGPTREYLDPVRFISNGSSGRMGAALAAAVLKRGGLPIIVSGPVQIKYPDGSEIHHVETTEQMLDACRKFFSTCSGVIGAAAPCDYRPLRFSTQKLSKSLLEDDVLTLQLVETLDILASLGETKRANQWILGFALETENGKTHALEKLKRKNCDFVALNSPNSINNTTADLQVFDASGNLRATLTGAKETVADRLLELVVR